MWKLRLLLLAFRRWTAQSKSVERHAPDSRDVTRVRCLQQGSQASRIQFRWFDHRLCPHAGGGDGKRSPDRLFQVSGDPVATTYTLNDLHEHLGQPVAYARMN